jgi:hypothetical protein
MEIVTRILAPTLKEQPGVDGCSLSGGCWHTYRRSIQVSSFSCVQELPVAHPVLANAMLAVLLASSTKLTGFLMLQRKVILRPKMKIKTMNGAHAQKVKALGCYC